MYANPLWRDTRSDVDARVMFQGAQSCISPGWYPSKAEHGKVVPTWNYVVVQARGRLRAIVGIEIELTSLVGKWKVTQNRGAADRGGVAASLTTLTDDAQAAAMAVEVAQPR